MNTQQKHLYFSVGDFGMLTAATDILEIQQYDAALCQHSGSAAQHHGKTVQWRDGSLPFLCLRECLQLEARDPEKILILQDAVGTALAVLGVDSVHEILTIDESLRFHFSGIHAELNTLFDQLYVYHQNQQILLQLKPAEQWIPALLRP
jgi:chemotaxis signal transduction protein